MDEKYQVRAIFDFQGQPESKELTICNGEILTVISQDGGQGWLEGFNSKGESGFFPADYVEVLSTDVPIIHVLPATVSSPSISSTSANYSVDDMHVRHYSPMQQDYYGGSTAWDDSWDDDDSSHDDQDHLAERKASATDSRLSLPVRDKKSSSTGDLATVGRESHGLKEAVKRSFNRFSAFVKSGGEAFILGQTKLTVCSDEFVNIVEDENKIAWTPNPSPYVCSVTKPKKESKLKGLKSYIVYQLTPSFSHIQVSRRYKHFDWLHERLEGKFTLIPIPPLPGKHFSGRYEDIFIEHRMSQLQMWVNRICRHPVLSECDVWKHFISCTDKKLWKEGKRRAEKDELVGASFFLAVNAPQVLLETHDLEKQTEGFGKFMTKMENSVRQLYSTVHELDKKFTGTFRREYQKLAACFKDLGETFEMEASPYPEFLTKAIMSTGDVYEEIGNFYKQQPRVDLDPISNLLHEYKGILGYWPEILHIHKGAMNKKNEQEKFVEDGKLSQEEASEICRRTNIISYVTLAEINHFQQEQIGDFKNMFENFLQAQVTFYQKIAQRLQETLDLFKG